MSKALVVGGDHIDGIKQVLNRYGIYQINHWSGRKTGDGRKEIPHSIDMIVLITDWINHSFTHRIKHIAAKRGVKIIYTRNSIKNLSTQLANLQSIEAECRKAIQKLTLFIKSKHLSRSV